MPYWGQSQAAYIHPESLVKRASILLGCPGAAHADAALSTTIRGRGKRPHCATVRCRHPIQRRPAEVERDASELMLAWWRCECVVRGKPCRAQIAPLALIGEPGRRGRCYPLRILGLYTHIGTPVWGRKSRKRACFTRTWAPEPLRFLKTSVVWVHRKSLSRG